MHNAKAIVFLNMFAFPFFSPSGRSRRPDGLAEPSDDRVHPPCGRARRGAVFPSVQVIFFNAPQAIELPLSEVDFPKPPPRPGGRFGRPQLFLRFVKSEKLIKKRNGSQEKKFVFYQRFHGILMRAKP
jgi:hypothetical protein